MNDQKVVADVIVVVVAVVTVVAVDAVVFDVAVNVVETFEALRRQKRFFAQLMKQNGAVVVVDVFYFVVSKYRSSLDG